MKATVSRQIQRCNARRDISSAEQFPEATIRASALRLCVHAAACLVCIILGFCFAREALLVGISSRQAPADSTSQTLPSNVESLPDVDILSLKRPYVPEKSADAASDKLLTPPVKSSRVHVGRHEILIRPWPRPNPVEVAAAHALLHRVQQEQRRLYVAQEWRPVIAITPTFSRTFQWLHLTGLMHTLMLVPGPLTWIVIEAGGITNETASLLAQSGLQYFHLTVDQPMPAAWSQRRSMESFMRVKALRFVREQKLDGVIVFADDSNTHSLSLFNEIQNVKWLGAVSVGILANYAIAKDPQEVQGLQAAGRQLVSVQGPSCNESCSLIGWHVFSRFDQTAKFDDSRRSAVSTEALEWAGFVMNSRILWGDPEKPDYITDWNKWVSDQVVPHNPLGLVKDQAFIEPLGNCGREVLLWWLRVEARADSKFPSRWMMDPLLKVVVPAKRTPWPDAHLEHPSRVNSAESLGQSDRQKLKLVGRTSRPKRARHSNKQKEGLSTRANSSSTQGQ